MRRKKQDSFWSSSKPYTSKWWILQLLPCSTQLQKVWNSQWFSPLKFNKINFKYIISNTTCLRDQWSMLIITAKWRKSIRRDNLLFSMNSLLFNRFLRSKYYRRWMEIQVWSKMDSWAVQSRNTTLPLLNHFKEESWFFSKKMLPTQCQNLRTNKNFLHLKKRNLDISLLCQKEFPHNSKQSKPS